MKKQLKKRLKKQLKKRLEKGVSGEITVFLALVFLSLFSLFAVFIEGIRVRNAKTDMERELNIGLSSAFSEYYRPLWQEYHLFGRPEEGLEESIREYMTLNYGLLPDELKIEEIICETEYDGKIFLHQAEAYEKYRLGKEKEETAFSEQFFPEADKALRKLSEQNAEEASWENTEDCEEGRAERRKLRNLKEFWSKNILEMVLDNPAEVSKKGLVNGPSVGGERFSISSTSPEKNLRQLNLLLKEQEVKKTELSYYRRHFKSYCKPQIHFQKKESLLDYELEYLLEGRGSDRDNLEAVLRRLVLTRTMINYLLINKDEEKSQKAYGFALAALGVTGIESLIRAAQQFILLGWGYEEALVDVRLLLEGGSVSLWKPREEFSISFEEIFMASREMIQGKSRQRLKEKRLAAMDYEDYLQLFLGFKKEEKRRTAAWYLIEENLRLRYDKRFSLEDTVFGAHIKLGCYFPGRLKKDWYLETERHYSY